MFFFMAILMGLFGGPVLALVMRGENARKGYDKRKAKFLAGEGKDPDKDPWGPHKSYASNAIIMGLFMFAVGLAAGFGAQMAMG